MTIRELRKQVGLSQDKFARELGISTACVVKWEKDKSTPNITQQGKLKEFCKRHDIDAEKVEI
jgi:DNA-binding transcriptional regulator YiaG